MNILDLLKGKTVSVMTDAKVEVPLIIKEVKEEHNSRDLEPATRENDWWPAQQTWTTWVVSFTNGYTKTYGSLSEIKILENNEIIFSGGTKCC